MFNQNNYFNNLYELMQRDYSYLQDAFIDLKYKNIQSEEASKLSSQIENWINIKYLDLNLFCNYIKKQGAAELGCALSKCQNLQKLKLSLYNNYLQDEGAYNLISPLKACLNLVFLDIDLTDNQIGPAGCLSLGLSLSKLESLLDLNLNLSSNSIGDEGAQNLLSNSDNFQSLKSLNLQILNCKIGVSGSQNLGYSLVKIANLEDLTINISYNNMQSEGLKSLCSSFFNNEQSQIKLSLDAKSINLFNNHEFDFQSVFSLNFSLKSLSICLFIDSCLNYINIKNFGLGLSNCKNLSTLSLEIYNGQDQFEENDLYSALAQCKSLNHLFISIEQRYGENEFTENFRQKCLKLKRLVKLSYYLFE
ncbi:kinase domain protein (macronuclear) [Tetrahymena thermophila SB210]|uniref:Kinase domain protein n=1 Tax=Tetrahymena thermophila (strain SB210) TaxID=312017 RepID=W7XLF2_TETTS|nr:kinase domain protein [Tetrahymena thermophila SB210]EWS76184.1 kinase domain protein [Tetrahymena thermophila SB210]|eukprot:XP_012651231.1 kinase domain protein [Tetrahymena thermophila SB210]